MIVIPPEPHIVVVDDSESDRLIIEMVLEASRLNNPVLMHESGPACLTYLEGCREGGDVLPALMMLDINMPGMTGLDLLEKIRSVDAFRNVPIVTMLTSSDAPRDKERAEALGANDYLTKQSGISNFVAMIDRAFSNS